MNQMTSFKGTDLLDEIQRLKKERNAIDRKSTRLNSSHG